MLESKRDKAWRAFDQASRDFDQRKGRLLDEIGVRLEQRLERTPLSTLQWKLI
jgi:hypothetical protein